MPPKKTAGDKRKREEERQSASQEKDEVPVADSDHTEDVKADNDAEDSSNKDDTADQGDDEKDTGADEDKDDEQEPKAKVAKTERDSVLDWLLSDDAFEMANPEVPKGHGEVDWDSADTKTPPPESAGKGGKGSNQQESILRYPHSHLTPFQNLIAACLLSKPISHKLGLRTIQTLLNPPFGLRTLSDLDEAGYEGRRKVMWEARTQHKEKTAGQLGDVCEGIKELCGDKSGEDELSELQGVRDQVKGMEAKEAADKVTDLLTQIKGIGPGVAAIFLRRVQGDWEEVFPYADDKSIKAAEEFGLISDGQGAQELKEKVGGDRGQFVRLLDVLVGLTLEKALDKAKEAAGV